MNKNDMTILIEVCRFVGMIVVIATWIFLFYTIT